MDRFALATASIDRANSADPYTIRVGPIERPKELTHSDMVTSWIYRLRPEPSEELLLAARAHHLRRWAVPRDSYPEGRAGYLRWRREAAQRQADEVSRILSNSGYDAYEVDRVRAIMTKRNLAGDPDVQAFEDAMCLVFLETQLDELAGKLDRERTLEVLRKTMAKMSRAGLDLVATLDLSESGKAIVEAAATEG